MSQPMRESACPAILASPFGGSRPRPASQGHSSATDLPQALRAARQPRLERSPVDRGPAHARILIERTRTLTAYGPVRVAAFEPLALRGHPPRWSHAPRAEVGVGPALGGAIRPERTVP